MRYIFVCRSTTKDTAMRLPALLLLAAAAFLPVQAPAAPPDEAVKTLAAEIKAHAPANWEVRVRWHEGQLLASVTPWPYQEAFNLWYAPAKLSDTLAALCPKANEEIWKLIKADQTVVIEPTVGGKSMTEARFTCRKANA
jgi:hypothetical protein